MLAVGFLALSACGNSADSSSPAAYVAEITQLRAEKDRAFLEGSDSPVPPTRRKEFLPLAYFPPDPDYIAPATLRVAKERRTSEMPTSAGKLRLMERVGTMEFSLKGKLLTLTAFVEAGTSTDRLFVPFTDLTSGTETYPAGRYLDLDRTPTGIYTIDFNRAYHPYCYYDSKYDCPYPPPENRLQLPIRAGERMKGSQGPGRAH